MSNDKILNKESDSARNIAGLGTLENPNDMDYTVEQLVSLINAARLNHLQKESGKEFTELKNRQELISLLHRILKGINSESEKDGTLDGDKFKKVINDTVLDLEKKHHARRLDLQLDSEKNQEKLTVLDAEHQVRLDEIEAIKSSGESILSKNKQFTKEMRDRLLENIRMTVDDHDVKNQMQIQKVTRLENERSESYQMARAIMKTLNDMKIQHLRGIRNS